MMCYDMLNIFFWRFTVTFKSEENLKTKGIKYERVIKTGIEQKWLLNKLGKNDADFDGLRFSRYPILDVHVH